MKIALIYYGGQYNHLILKNLKYLGVEAAVFSTDRPVEELNSFDGIIFSGGPFSVKDEISKMGNSPLYVKETHIPKLGICLGHQLISYVLGGKVKKATSPEYGLIKVEIQDNDTILSGFPKEFNAWESHWDEVIEPPSGFKVLASSHYSKVQAIVNHDNTVFGVQFHPEVKHTENGTLVFKNFISAIKK
ncbi:GMP synthase subunit A [Sulfuracidifex metallicus]|uniref:GMP synthase [glutamine-hydrolyzing] subunit A n=1 Tax=Sulfuracidifex metallicus DSM 6482 = JCM 9184 TaxID=523847 RepID=A0A6A9QLW9_SULME|nr:GMP synthase subunit A [Sulfuracidifex metallicus DSM 6482 = JCM 9184]WOE50329.1 GMP synthase subunit A [Sulfuracidifex metallicus DSM 6482 = JCM 9184]